MSPTLTQVATLPQEDLAMAETLTSPPVVAGLSVVVTWLLTRLLNNPDEVRKELAAIRAELQTEREHRIKLQSRLGSEGDVGTVMHTLSEMRDETRQRFGQLESMLRDLTNKRG